MSLHNVIKSNYPLLCVQASISFSLTCILYLVSKKVYAFDGLWDKQGRIQPKVEGGAICRVGSKNIEKRKRAEGTKTCLGLSSGKILVFLLNNALIDIFPTFRTKHEKRVN